MDPELWKIENYLKFLAERRKLLAQAANDFLDKLWRGNSASVIDRSVRVGPSAIQPVGGIADEDEERLLAEMNAWVVAQGLPEGDLSMELLEEADGQVVGYLDLAWPNGLQEGLSQPVALLIDEGPETEEAANKAGFRFFTDVDSFRSYVEREVLAVANGEVVGA